MFCDYKENIGPVEKIHVLILEVFTYFCLSLTTLKKRNTLSCLVMRWKWEPRLGPDICSSLYRYIQLNIIDCHIDI
jgi:hypothetical protein